MYALSSRKAVVSNDISRSGDIVNEHSPQNKDRTW